MNRRRGFAAGAFVLLVAGLAAERGHAHNVAVTHPEITDVAMELLRKEDRAANGASGALTDPCDACSFSEIWDHRGALTPPATGFEDAGNYHAAFTGGNASVMIGAVVEDGHNLATELRVVNHFYHAITGVGLLDDYNSSQFRAQQLFLYGLELHDYTDQSRRRSYLYLGRFLHHIEDMSSPAHVHNDAHLYVGGFDSDMDDYEGRYVPGIVWLGGALRGKLTSPTSVSRNVTSASDIWSAPVAGAPAATYSPPEGSLSGYIFNRSSYWANLQYPTNGTPPPAPTGELAQMFPGDPGDPGDLGLHWVSPTIGFDRWEISGVGEYHYKASWGTEDDWWPDTAANERSAGNPAGVLAQYYLEQLMTGDTVATTLVPDRLRQNFAAPWNATTNPVVQNATCSGGTNPGAACSKQSDCSGGTCTGASIPQLQSDHLLVPVVEYVAGGAKWWFRYANLPPILKKLSATQGTVGTKYTAEWLDQVENQPRNLVEAGAIPNTTENIDFVTKRNFSHSPLERKYINALTDLTVVLEFNEPIRDLLELKLLNASGGEVRDLLPVAGTPVKADAGKKWTYTITAANLTGLNGELTLKVRARDLNEHVQDGGELDATPGSPAKRNLTGTIDLRAPNLPWHTTQTDPNRAYDFTQGDRNHRLLFDTVKPNTTITKTP